ncbi:MAG: methionyl-tRNA formyltransferase [Bryobacterales bacterium]|nr:methionyl-tRNA formyltransferase [Bryobacteraceae bacterium]MDW8129384.1 methionyl-tRNA formyltransferase [Bryobacterales bacterium]
MRLVFFGTPEFAVPSLEALVRAGHRVLAVITQPDRPAGRKQELASPPVKQRALELGLEVRQPERIRDPEFADWLRALEPEAGVVVGYGKIIPPAIFQIPRHGIVNVHASLLPRYRGAAPIEWAIANGETRTGVTTIRIDEGLDTGDILLQRETEIGEEESAVELRSRLAELGAELLVETLAGLEAGTIRPRPQDHAQATLAPMLRKEDGRIEWSRSATEIARRVRAFVPWPGAYTWLRGKLLHLWRARPAAVALTGPPGALAAEGERLLVACGGGTTLEIVELQLEGRRRMSAAEFLRGFRLKQNERFGEPTQ